MLKRKTSCQISLPGFLLYLSYAFLYRQLLFEMPQSVYLTLVFKLIGYADDSTLIAVVPTPGVRVAVAESLIRDLAGLVSGVTFGG